VSRTSYLGVGVHDVLEAGDNGANVLGDADQVVLVAQRNAVVNEGLDLAVQVRAGVVVSVEEGERVHECLEAAGLDEEGLVAQVAGHLGHHQAHGEVGAEAAAHGRQ